MPRIKVPQIDSSVRAPGPVGLPSAPSLSPEGAGAEGGRYVQQAGAALSQGIDAVQQRVAQDEVSDINAKMSQTQADFTTKWQETLRTADPGDKTIADKFMADYDKNAEDMQSNISTRQGQNYFRDRNAKVREHFQVTANSAQAELAGVKAKSDYTSTIRNLSDSLIQDPSSYALAVQSHDATLGSLVSTGLLSREAALELKTKNMPELAESAIRGWIKLSPEIAKKQLDGGIWNGDISGDKMHELYREVDTAQRARRADAERADLDAQAAKRQLQDSAQTQFIKDLLLPGQPRQFSLKEVLDNPVLEFEQKKELVNMADKYNREGGKIKPDASVIANLFQRIHSPENAPDHISDEKDLNPYFANGLDGNSLSMLRGEVQGRRTTEGKMAAEMKAEMTKTAYAALVKKDIFGLADEQGSQNYLRYLGDFLNEWQEKTQAGVPARDMVNPKSENYMGNRFLSYKKSLGDKIDSMSQALGGKAAPTSPYQAAPPSPVAAPATNNDRKRKAGESPQDYLKRIGLEK